MKKYNKDWEKILETILDLSKEKGKGVTINELIQLGLISDDKGINKYLKNETEYKDYKDFYRKNGYKISKDVYVNGKIIGYNELSIEDLKTLFNEYKNKYNKFPSCLDCKNENNLPSWDMIKKILLKNNMTIENFYISIGNNSSAILSNQNNYDKFIKRFKEICNKLGRPLKYKELINNDFGLPTSRWFVIHCPNEDVHDYNTFLHWLGYITPFNITKEDAIKIIYNMQSKLDRPLMQDDFYGVETSKDCVSIRIIQKYWNNMNSMKESLHLEILQEDMTAKQKSKEEMLDDLQNYIDKLGRLPFAKEINSNPNIVGACCYNRYFGGINDAFLALGYKPNKKSISLNLSNQEIIGIYKDFIDDFDGVPSYDFCKKVYKLPSPRTILRRFNCSWNDFIIKLGYTPNTQIASANVKYAHDGTLCLSTAEYYIHNLLLEKNIDSLEKETFYKDILNDPILQEQSGYKRLDWTFKYKNKLYLIEFFGLMTKESYRKRHNEKLNLIKLDGKMDNFIALYPKDLKKLDKIFEFLPNKKINNKKGLD